MADVQDQHENVSQLKDLEAGPKCRHKLGWEARDKPDGVDSIYADSLSYRNRSFLRCQSLKEPILRLELL